MSCIDAPAFGHYLHGMETVNDPSASSYSTLDAYVAGFLSLKGHHPKLADQGGKIAFVFQLTAGLRRSLEEFNSGATVKASAYVFEIKSLKSRIHEVRREKGSYREPGYQRT
jgi:hypothetical protein